MTASDKTKDGGSSAVADTHRATETPVVGQWAVIAGSWRDEVAEITKVSAKQVRTRRYGDREANHLPQDIIFSGGEKQARDLLSVLKGLGDRNERNRKQLAEQHRASRAAAIAKATTASSVGMSEANAPSLPTGDA